MTHTRYLGLLHTFRLQMDFWHYTRVFIWDSPESMWASHPKLGRDYYGLAISGVAWATADKICIARKFGELHLYQNGYDPRTIAHEIQHLVNYWIQSKGWNLEKNDEQIALLCGNLHEGFWTALSKLERRMLWT